MLVCRIQSNSESGRGEPTFSGKLDCQRKDSMSTVWEKLYQQGKIWSTTRSLLDCLVLDTWPGPPVILDFGIDSPKHYAALRYSILFDDKPEWSSLEEKVISELVRAELTNRILELNRALQHGGRLTAFVQKYAPGDLADVVFDTGMDDFAEQLERDRARMRR
jgi:hypothetical protein